MTVKTEPFISGKYGWDFGESGWNVGADENWLKFSYLHSSVFWAQEPNDSNAAAYADGQAYWNTSDLTINPKVNGVTRKYSVPIGHIFTAPSGAKYEFTGTALGQAVNSADKVKLNGISANATANSSDINLRDRATHTGVQSTNTISTLDAQLISLFNNKAPLSNPTFTNNISIPGGSSKIYGNWSAAFNSATTLQSVSPNGDTSIVVSPNGTATTSGINFFNSSNVDNASYLSLSAAPTKINISAGAFGAGSNLPLTVDVAGAERLRITVDGKVGIGTNSPTEQLHVAGNAKVTGNMSLGAASIGLVGYTTLPNGLILQWALCTTSSAGSVAATFPIAFPNARYSIIATVINDVGIIATIGLNALAGCTVYTRKYDGTAVSENVFIMALGN